MARQQRRVLNEDIMAMVYDLLATGDRFNVACSSKALYHSGLPALYCHINLGKLERGVAPVSCAKARHLFARLTVEGVADLVRSLEVDWKTSIDDARATSELGNALPKLVRLRILRIHTVVCHEGLDAALESALVSHPGWFKGLVDLHTSVSIGPSFLRLFTGLRTYVNPEKYTWYTPIADTVILPHLETLLVSDYFHTRLFFWRTQQPLLTLTRLDMHGHAELTLVRSLSKICPNLLELNVTKEDLVASDYTSLRDFTPIPSLRRLGLGLAFLSIASRTRTTLWETVANVFPNVEKVNFIRTTLFALDGEYSLLAYHKRDLSAKAAKGGFRRLQRVNVNEFISMRLNDDNELVSCEVDPNGYRPVFDLMD